MSGTAKEQRPCLALKGTEAMQSMAVSSNVALISPHDTQAKVFDCVECGVGLGFYAHVNKSTGVSTVARHVCRTSVPGCEYCKERMI